MTPSLLQRYQISERDMRQRLAVYHRTRGGGAFARWREFRRPLATSGSWVVIYRFLAPMGDPEPYLDELVEIWRWERAADGRVIVSPHRRNLVEQIEHELKNQEQMRRLRFERVD